MKQFAILLACLGAAACSHANPDTDTLSQLRAMGRDAACDSDQQCRTVPLGAKSCGGPEGYLAYSTARSDPARVAQLAERYRKQRSDANSRSGMASDCRFMADPGAACVAGKCQLGGALDR
jgi:hypothetical protein